jgi:hypothetical protein
MDIREYLEMYEKIKADRRQCPSDYMDYQKFIIQEYLEIILRQMASDQGLVINWTSEGADLVYP